MPGFSFDGPVVSATVFKGEIPEDGIVSRLSEIEGYRTTGVLRFEYGETSGEVALVQGQISADQPETPKGDLVEMLLELRAGTFELVQQLPPLPVSKGDTTFREGSLEVHIPADLMNYCERAGLTGVLEIRDGEQVAEIAYAKGELHGIRLDGLDELHQVFGWEEGTFRIEVRGAAPDYEAELTEPPPPADPSAPAPAPDADATGKHFLKVVEVTLAEIVKEREERRPATRTSPPLPPMSGPKKHPTLRPPDMKEKPKPPGKERKDQTVRVIYLSKRDEKRPAAPTPTPSTKRKSEPRVSSPRKSSVSERKEPVNEEPIQLPTLAWVGITLLVVIAALVLLANLPPIE